MRKPPFCICENKDADQLRNNREADQHLCFRYTDSTIPLLSKSLISSLYLSSVVVQPGFRGTWSETLKTGFLATRLVCLLLLVVEMGEQLMMQNAQMHQMVMQKLMLGQLDKSGCGGGHAGGHEGYWHGHHDGHYHGGHGHGGCCSSHGSCHGGCHGDCHDHCHVCFTAL